MRLALLSPLEHGSKDAISTHTLQLVKHLTPMLQQTQLVVRRWSGEQLEGVKVQESGTFPIRSLGDVVGAFLTVLQLRKHVDIIYSRSPLGWLRRSRSSTAVSTGSSAGQQRWQTTSHLREQATW